MAMNLSRLSFYVRLPLVPALLKLKKFVLIDKTNIPGLPKIHRTSSNNEIASFVTQG